MRDIEKLKAKYKKTENLQRGLCKVFFSSISFSRSFSQTFEDKEEKNNSLPLRNNRLCIRREREKRRKWEINRQMEKGGKKERKKKHDLYSQTEFPGRKKGQALTKWPPSLPGSTE